MGMNITRLFQYTKQMVPFGCRKSVGVVFTGQVEVTIPEVTAAKAPVAIIQAAREYVNTGKRSPDAKPWQNEADQMEWDHITRIVTYRWYKGQLWTTTDVSDLWHRGEHPDYKVEYPTPENPAERWAYGAPKYWDAAIFRSKEEKIAEIQAWAAEYLIVDGVVHKKADEPRYAVHTQGLGCDHGGTSIRVEYAYNSNLSWRQYFRLDQYNKALAYATKIADGRGDKENRWFDPEDRFEIVLPRCIRLNPKQWGSEGDEFQPEGRFGRMTKLRDPVAAGLAMMMGVAGSMQKH